MSKAIETMDGWFCLHDFKTIDWKAWKNISNTERQTAIEEFKEIIDEWTIMEKNNLGSHVMYNAIGHKADLMSMFLRETPDELAEIETQINKSKIGDYLITTHSYLSVVEIAKYRFQRDDGVDPETLPEVQKRLRPTLPKLSHMSFYPMKRRRTKDENWYTLKHEDRTKLLYEHSLTGRKYLDKIEQITTGSIGLDMWEWAITLFSNDALQLKKIVYEMRFDEASARYGEFGDFYIGNYLSVDDLERYLNM